MIDSQFFITGRIGKIIPKTQMVTSVSIAVDERRKTDSGWQTSTHWFYVTFFGKQAEAIQKAHPGAMVSIHGEIKTYKDQNGKTGFSFNAKDAVIGVGLFGLGKQSNPESVQPAPDFGPEPLFDESEGVPF